MLDKQDRNEVGQHVGGDGIGSEDDKWLRPRSATQLDVAHPVAGGEGNQGASGGEQNERAGPQLLVDGKPDVPDLPGHDSGNAEGQHAQRLSWRASRFLRSHSPVSTPSSAVAIAGSVLRYAFGIARLLVHSARQVKLVDVPATGLRRDVEQRHVAAGHAESRYRNEPHRDPVADQQAGDPESDTSRSSQYRVMMEAAR